MGAPKIDPREAYYADNVSYTLEEHVKHLIKMANEVRIATGYFYSSGYYLIEDLVGHLSEEKGIKLLIGKETDTQTKDVLVEGTEAYAKSKQTFREEVINAFGEDARKIEDEELEERLIHLYNHLKLGLVKPKVWTDNKFHPKLYLFRGDKEGWSSEGIVGSSNFTEPGLRENIELNVMLRDSNQIKSLEKWFDELYDKADDIREELLEAIETTPSFQRQKDPHYVTPWELFLCVAKEFLQRQITYAKDFLADFQKTGYYAAMDKIEKYGGCIVADSVGLGKSFIGGEILKYFYEQEGKSVLALVPAHIVDQWKDLLEKDGPPNNPSEVYFGLTVDNVKISVESQGVLSRIKPEDAVARYGQYDVILVDEAHRFRNDPNEIVRCRALKALKDNKVRGDQDAVKFIFLTATPLNNSIKDLYNLINLLVNRNRLESYEGMNLKAFESFERLRKKEAKADGIPLTGPEQKELLSSIKNIERILNEVMILRNREYLQSRPGGLVIGGRQMAFSKPSIRPLHYQQEHLKYRQLYEFIPQFFEGLKAPHIVISNPNAGMVLQGLYKVLLLKRLESSIYSFWKSLHNYLGSLSELEGLLNDPNISFEEIVKYKIHEGDFKGLKSIASDPDLMAFMDDADLTQELTEEKKEDFFDEETIRSWIIEDRRLINQLINDYFLGEDGIKTGPGEFDFDDIKIKHLLDILNDERNEKILVFTQFQDTIKYLRHHVKVMNERRADLKRRNWAVVTGSGCEHYLLGESVGRRDVIWMFSPVANERRKADGKIIEVSKDSALDLLLTTDALSEGANLQDCNFLINYDLPWNPTRIIQRIGRIDRIVREGQPAPNIVYNFILEEALQLHISLIRRLRDKIHQITTIIGKEYGILHDDEEIKIKTYGEKYEDDDIIRFKRNLERIQEAETTTALANIGRNKFLSSSIGEDEKSQWAISIEHLLRDYNATSEEMENARKKFPATELKYAIYKGPVPGLFLFAQIWDFKRKRKRENLTYFYNARTSEISEEDPGNMGFRPTQPGYGLENVPSNFSIELMEKAIVKRIEERLERHRNDVRGMHTQRYGSDHSKIQKAIGIHLERLQKNARLDEPIPDEIKSRFKDDTTWYQKVPLSKSDGIALKKILGEEWHKWPVTELFEKLHEFRLRVESSDVEYRTARINPEELTVKYIAGGICFAEP